MWDSARKEILACLERISPKNVSARENMDFAKGWLPRTAARCSPAAAPRAEKSYPTRDMNTEAGKLEKSSLLHLVSRRPLFVAFYSIEA